LNRRAGVVLAWLTAGAALAIGCGGGLPSNFVEPKIGLQNVVVKGLGFRGGNLDAVLTVENPNSFDIRGNKLEMTLDLEGVKFGPTQLDQVFTLAANQPTPLTVPVSFDWGTVGSAARQVLGYGTAKYTLDGKVTIQVGGGNATVPFTQKGTITVSQLRSGTSAP